MDLTTLNNKQREAVLETEGATLVLAGAGSGKTKVLTSKIAYLIEEKNISEYNILAFTFTNKAAQEMKERIGGLLNKNVDHMWVGTFHSICSRILRRNIDRLGYKNNFTIYDTADQKTLIKDILKELNYSDDNFNPMGVLSQISDYRNRFVGPDEVIDKSSFPREKQIGEIYKLYEKEKKENNALDFDDLILKTIELLETDDQVRSYYATVFRYVFVDEYQDTNQSQYRLIQHFTQMHKNVCVVGDADQSIYGWRGADISNILNFEKDYKNAKVILLEQNYRSSQTILDAANKLIKNNTERKDKRLWTENNKGSEIIYKQLANEYDEGKEVVSWIYQMQNDGHSFEDMAILYRTNSQSRIFEEQLMREGIPHRVIGGLKFYDRKEVKDMIAYLNVIVNPDDDLALKRIINTPKRGIGPKSVEKLERYALEKNSNMFDSIYDEDLEKHFTKGSLKKIRDFADLITNFRTYMDDYLIEDLLTEVYENSGYKQSLLDSNAVEDRTRMENIESLINAVTDYEKNNEDANLVEYLQNISLLSDVDKTDEAKGISLMTIHASKGLEYDVVFLTGMEEGLFPSRISVEEGGLEEERRLCYVAITRAKKQLFMSSASSRMVWGRTTMSTKSRFLEEMEGMYKDDSAVSEVQDFDFDFSYFESKRSEYRKEIKKKKEIIDKKQAENYQAGDKVKHKRFGEGTVVQVTGNELLIAFDGKGIKRLNSTMAPISKL